MQEIGYMVTYGVSAASRLVLLFLYCKFFDILFLLHGLKQSVHVVAAQECQMNQEQTIRTELRMQWLSILSSLCFFLLQLFWLVCGHNIWADFFIDSNANYAVLKEDFASMTPQLAISIIVYSVQGVFSGCNSPLFLVGIVLFDLNLHIFLRFSWCNFIQFIFYY